MSSEEKHVSKPLKDSQLIVRMSGADRDRFVSLCEAMDTSAAREVRRFVRDFLMQHDVSTQPLPQTK